jgi:hypothetical protein
MPTASGVCPDAETHKGIDAAATEDDVAALEQMARELVSRV